MSGGAIAIVIPTLNEASELPHTLAGLRAVEASLGEPVPAGTLPPETLSEPTSKPSS